MARDLDTIVRGFLADLDVPEAAPIRSVVLYGSAATPTYVPGRSDLNFLIVAAPVTRELLATLRTRMKGWAKQRVSPPLVIDGEFLHRSTDSYPLEILGMQAAYRVLRGADPLAGLAPAPEHVRVQVEREAKSKELLLRRGFLESLGRHRNMVSYLGGVLPAIDAMLRGMLYLHGGEWRQPGPSMRTEAAGRIGLDAAVLVELHELRYGRRPDRITTESLYERTLALIDTIARGADRPVDRA
jgi:hypothetical protein